MQFVPSHPFSLGFSSTIIKKQPATQYFHQISQSMKNLKVLLSHAIQCTAPTKTDAKTYDISVLTENQTFTGSETRLCGLRFIRLTKVQKERLAILLERCGRSSWQFPDPF